MKPHALLSHFDWLLVRLQLKCGSKLSKLHWHVEIITAEMVSIREYSSQQNSQKNCIYSDFSYKFLVILPEILSVINSRESGFSRILKRERAIGCTFVEQSKMRNEHGSGNTGV
jgi:hypothetical protein